MPGIQCSDIFVAPVQNLAWGGVFKLKDTGYPVFRFAKDVIVNNNEVIEEQERMAKLSGMKDTWTVTAVKPKYQTYVVVIGESALSRCPRCLWRSLGQYPVCQQR